MSYKPEAWIGRICRHGVAEGGECKPCVDAYIRDSGITNTATRRKQQPLYSGLLTYFPDALLEVAHCSWVGNEQHNPGQPLHWAKEKSSDEPDALMRHLLEAGKRDSDGVRHTAKVAWRALAMLQREIEKERNDEKPSDLSGMHTFDRSLR